MIQPLQATPPPDAFPVVERGVADTYRCGTLAYTKAGLFALFSWLLWGDFCFTLMEQIWPNVLPLMLKAHDAPNRTVAIIMTTIPSVMNFVLNPIISTASDRHRGPRGRRVPFLLVATPMITVFLILLGFSGEIGLMTHHALVQFWPGVSEAAVTIALIGILVASFRFFELFVNTVFWYLFNDVVPLVVMGRFLALFRIVGSLAGAAFNFFLLKYADSHASAVFLGVALLYGTIFFLMCLNIKEGQYPPPDAAGPARKKLPELVRGYFRECFSSRIYRLVFTYNFLFFMGSSVNAFVIFSAFSVGLTLAQVGQVAGAAALVGIVIMYPLGILIDRFKPMPIMVATQSGACLAYSVKTLFLFHDFSAEAAFWIYAVSTALAVALTAATAAAALPMGMCIFPKARFGQFCAAGAMCGAVGTIIGGFLVGGLLDFMKSVWRAGDFYYRLVPVWSACLTAGTAVAVCLVYREWRRLGGEREYVPPASETVR